MRRGACGEWLVVALIATVLAVVLAACGGGTGSAPDPTQDATTPSQPASGVPPSASPTPTPTDPTPTTPTPSPTDPAPTPAPTDPTPTPTPAPTPTDPVPTTAPAPSAQFLPMPTGTCPALVNGDVTFAPAGIAPRKVRIWIGSAAATKDGPLVFYWHGTGSSPSEATYGLSQPVIDAITAAGGLVAAPYADPAAGTFPWFLTTGGTRVDDLVVADEVLACARQQVGVDVRHIHSIGMSAGGLQTAQMSYRRSGYLASVVTYSGGLASSYGVPARQDPTNPFSALIFDGGANDVVVIDFQTASETYWSELTGHGQFAAICDHGGGHTIPTDARDSVWAFFQAHPFGVKPSPYAAGLPASFPDYCALTP